MKTLNLSIKMTVGDKDAKRIEDLFQSGKDVVRFKQLDLLFKGQVPQTLTQNIQE